MPNTVHMLNDFLFFFIGTFVSLFSIVDPLMAAPLFVTLTDGETPKQREVLARRASTYSFAILTLFFVSGSVILNFFQISIDALRIAGGLMILSSAYGMFNKQESLAPDEQQEARAKVTTNEDIAFSPLAMPILSGPGAIAVIIGMTANAGGFGIKYLLILLAIIAVAISSYITMRISDKIMHKMGSTMVKSFTRIMGFILLCIGVQFMVNGILPILTQVIHHAK